jgi:hypothetical protein
VTQVTIDQENMPTYRVKRRVQVEELFAFRMPMFGSWIGLDRNQRMKILLVGPQGINRPFDENSSHRLALVIVPVQIFQWWQQMAWQLQFMWYSTSYHTYLSWSKEVLIVTITFS